MKLTYQVSDKPTFGQVIVFALQQMLAILAATIAVPTIIGNGMSQSAALFGAGIGTIVYLLFTKFKSPVFLGSSFAFIGSMFAAFGGAASISAGYLGLIIGAAFAGLVYVVIALIVKFAGVKWINKLMPAVVIGPTVAIIGLSLAGNAIGDLNKTNYVTAYDPDNFQYVAFSENDYSFDSENGLYTFNNIHTHYPSIVVAIDKDADITKPVSASKVHPDYTVSYAKDENGTIIGVGSVTKNNGSSYVAVICGLTTLLVTIICSVFGKKMLKMIPFIVGICAGYSLAAIFTLIGAQTANDALRVIDFSAFANMKWLPDFTFIKAFSGFADINAKYIAALAVAYIPVAFVVFAEHIADHKNISSIIEKDLLEDPGLSRTLLGDGVGSVAGALFGGCPNTTYGESVGCVAISGNASIVTIIATALLCLVSAFLAPFTTFLSTIPSCVMGGVCISLYGFIAVSGLKMVQNVNLEDNRNLFVVSVILIAGIGGMSLTFGAVTLTEVACALILGVIVNLILSKKSDRSAERKN